MTSLKRFLEELRAQGFGFALDDFGSGYNSFRYLRELHFDYLKIDGEFVKNMLNNKTDQALVESLQHLCGKLGIKTIAEYVENDEILSQLKSMGITYYQGFITGLPSKSINNSRVTI